MRDYEKLKSAIKLIIDEFMIAGNSDLYRHMTKSIDGQNVANWFNDSQLMNLSKYHGAFELELYRFIRQHRNEFLSEENKLLSNFGAVKVFWKSGGYSESVIYHTQSGERMLCCSNWTSGPVPLKSQLSSIKSIEKLGPVA